MTSTLFAELPKDIVTKIYLLLNNEDQAAMLASSKTVCTRIDWHRLYHDFYSPYAKEQNRVRTEKARVRIREMMEGYKKQLGINLFQPQ